MCLFLQSIKESNSVSHVCGDTEQFAGVLKAGSKIGINVVAMNPI